MQWWRYAMNDSTWQDFRLSLRIFRKNPAFTLAAIGTLALGIGANTAIFQLLDAVRLRSLPVPNPQELARIQFRGGNKELFGMVDFLYALTYPQFDQLRSDHEVFSTVFGWSAEGTRFGQGTSARHVLGLAVSGEFFPALQLRPAIGRLLGPDDDRPGCPDPGVVLSYSFWQGQFAGRASVIGSKVLILDRPYQVIGVAPARFTGLEVGRRFDVAMPMCAPGIIGVDSLARRDEFWVTVMGRLKPGVSFRRASAQLEVLRPGLLEATLPSGYSKQDVDVYKRLRLEAVPAANGTSELREHYDTSLWLLLGITGLVLLIACANLGNLMLARAGARQREYAVRLALGASRARLIRQSLSESLLLAFTGAAMGLGLAGALTKIIIWFLSTENDAPQLDLGLDWRMLAFTAAVATLACVIFGFVPALRSSQTDPAAVIKTGGRLTEGRERFSFQRFLVVVQIAVSLVLVVGAFLFVGSFHNLLTLDPGFRAKGVLLASFDLSSVPKSRIKPFQRQLLEEVRSVPGVESAATTSMVLIDGGIWGMGIQVGSVNDGAEFTWVSPDHFKTLSIPLLAGRDFNARDTETSPKVAIVNQTFVRQFFRNANPIAKTFRTVLQPDYPAADYQIVGVVKDTRHDNLRNEPPAMSFAPASQFPEPDTGVAMYVRSSAPFGAISSAIQRRMSALHPNVGVEFHEFQKEIENTLIRERLMAALSGFFGALAALLATIGLYGVISYVVVRRRNEIGIRMALGATRTQVISLVMRDATRLVLMGVAIGAACSLALGQIAASLLFGLKPYDPLTLLGSTLLLATVAALGSYLPARRASQLDPMAALRWE
jgi:predicted permease